MLSAQSAITVGIDDFRQGIAKASWPARFQRLSDGPLTDDAVHAEALALLRRHPAMAEASAEVRRWAAEARAVLAPLPNVPARWALEALCDSVADRTA